MNDNSHLEEKILLRLNSLEKIDKPEIKVLECFGGDGVVWGTLQKRTDKKIQTLRIDLKGDRKGVYLQGDNLKFLLTLDLTGFDIIDLDAYGMPIDQLEILFQRKYSGVVHVTWIMSGAFGSRFPRAMMEKLGLYNIYKKVPTLLSKNPIPLMHRYFLSNGIRAIQTVDLDKKHYFWFSTKK